MVALLMAVVLAAGLWQQWRHPRRIVATGQVRVADAATGQAMMLRTRVAERGSVRLEEVELPGGTWIDCGGDCAKAAREAGPEHWETMRRNSGGR
jgi:hypothetical protein